MPLQSLRCLTLEPDPDAKQSTVNDGADLAALAGARKAASLGRSSADMIAIASGLLETLYRNPSGEEPAFGAFKTYSEIEELDLKTLVKADEPTSTWLKKNVDSLEVKKWV